MATKTITIMEDAYDMLKSNQIKGESFSEEIRRILSRKKNSLKDLFGIISDEDGEEMLRSLEKRRKMNLKMRSRRLE